MMNDKNYLAGVAWPHGSPLKRTQEFSRTSNHPSLPPNYPVVVIDGHQSKPQTKPPASYPNTPDRHAPQGPPYKPDRSLLPQYPMKAVHRIPQPRTPIPNLDGTDDLPVKPVITKDLPVDYRLLLLSLADQYIEEARSLGALIAHNQAGADAARYYKLMATGMGCYEAILKKVCAPAKRPLRRGLTETRPSKQRSYLRVRKL